MLALEVFPAISKAAPLMVCDPRVVTVTGEGQVRIPDKLSEQVKLTVALAALIIPLLLGAGETAAVINGGVRSILSVVDAEELWPAASVAVAEMTWLAPCVLTVCGAGHCTGGTPPVH